MSQHIRTCVRFLLRWVCPVTILVVLAWCLTGWYVRSSATDALRRAERHLHEGENSRAREALTWLLWFEPEQHRALLLTGISLHADGRFSEAIAVLERIPEDSGSFVRGETLLAASLIEDGRLDRAESVLERLLSRFPQAEEAHDRLVRLYLLEFRKREALALLIDHWRRYPDDLSVLPGLLQLEANDVTPRGRVETLEAADRRHPGQAGVELALARAYSQLGMIEQAGTRFRAALELQPDDVETRILAAGYYLDCGDLETASSLLESTSPSTTGETAGELEDDRYWYLRCRLAEQSGDVETAHAHLQEALLIRPKEEAYLLLRADLLRRMGQSEQAVECAVEAAQLAEDRKRLMVLSDRLDRARPDPAHCLAIAELLERMGHAEQAADWRRVRSAVMQSGSGTPRP